MFLEGEAEVLGIEERGDLTPSSPRTCPTPVEGSIHLSQHESRLRRLGRHLPRCQVSKEDAAKADATATANTAATAVAAICTGFTCKLCHSYTLSTLVQVVIFSTSLHSHFCTTACLGLDRE